MKFLKSLICNCLCINNLYKINNIGISCFKKHIYEKSYPLHFLNFKKTKIYYLENNIYYDIYSDSLNSVNNFYKFKSKIKKSKIKKSKIKKSEIKKSKISNNYTNSLSLFKEYNYYNDLTAEHIFPQSYIKIYPKAKFDMHNIFLTRSELNNYRSNYKFIDETECLINFDNSINFENSINYDNYINYKNNSLKIFIPLHSSRGLIARSIAYMKYTYEDLILEKVIDKNTLLKWNYQYPPSEIEKKQNLLIKQVQGNENIFITNHELVNILLY